MGKRLPRTFVVERLRLMKDHAAVMVSHWSPTTTVYLSPGERDAYDGEWRRPRETHEYPENQARSWQVLAAYCDSIEQTARNLATYARQQGEKLEEENRA